MYRRMHAEMPLRWDADAFGFGCYPAASHVAVTKLLRDPRLSGDRSGIFRAFLPDVAGPARR